MAFMSINEAVAIYSTQFNTAGQEHRKKKIFQEVYIMLFNYH
jgi:hypothetical protein